MKKLPLLLILSFFSAQVFTEYTAYETFPVHEFAKSPLRDLEVQENWQLFKDPDELDLFHSRFKYAIDEKGPLRWWKMSSYVDDCERATAEFDIEAFKSIEETGDRASFFIRCKTFFTHKHFRDQDEGIKVFERILLSWAKNKPMIAPKAEIINASAIKIIKTFFCDAPRVLKIAKS